MTAMKWMLAVVLLLAAATPGLAQVGAAAEHAAPADADVQQSDSPTGEGDPLFFNPDLAFVTLIVFFCLLLVLKKLAWGPIVEALEARERGISDNIAAASAKHEEAKRLLAEHQAKIDAAAEDVREMLEEARRDAEATKTQIVAEARAAAEAERRRAVREIELAKDSAVKDLAEQSANLAVDLAGKVVRKEISQERQGEIVREALGLMGSGASNN